MPCVYFFKLFINIEITDDSFSASIYTLVSSANKIGKRTSETLDKSLIYNMKRSGPRILPCGTPKVTVSVLNLDVEFAQIVGDLPDSF